MKKSLLKILTLFLTAVFLTGCMESYYTKGVKKYDTMEYSEAASYLEKALAKQEIPDARMKLAHSYRLMNDAGKAEKEYAKVVKMGSVDFINYYYYAKALMMNKKYEMAAPYLRSYLVVYPHDKVARDLYESSVANSTPQADTGLYLVEKINIAGLKSAFSPTLYKNGIIFSADLEIAGNEKLSKTNGWTGNSFLNLYYMEKDSSENWTAPHELTGDINGTYHEGPAVVNSDSSEMFFTRSNYYKKKLIRSSENEINLKLFKAQLQDNKWTAMEELSFNNDEYSVGHPALSADGNTLYFISDKPGGSGGTDIYFSKKDTAGNWSAPENMGATINSAGNEMFPVLSGDSLLYYSSDALNTLGGLDIFVSRFNDTTWSAPENMKYPINTSKDDFSFILNKDGRSGFISSNRDGVDQIYMFREVDPVFNLMVSIKMKDLGNLITDAKIKVVNKEDNSELIAYASEDGMYHLQLKPNTDYKVYAFKDNYFTKSAEFTTKGKSHTEEIVIDFELEEIIIEKPIVMENIYYDLNKADIRPDAALELDKLVAILQDNPNINIELSAHTDSRGDDRYNLNLSTKRAKSAVGYVITKGIDPARLKSRGYGETMPVNHCTNGVACTEEEFAPNRRTEFKVINITNNNELLTNE